MKLRIEPVDLLSYMRIMVFSELSELLTAHSMAAFSPEKTYLKVLRCWKLWILSLTIKEGKE